jgi:hypothetical protein
MAKKSQLALALDHIDAEIARFQAVREALLATIAAVRKLEKSKPAKAPKPTKPIGVAS